MNPDAASLWTRPRWALAALLAMLSIIAPFSIDAYVPAFHGIAEALDATPVQMQQTLSAYLLGFAVMNLFHGALADSFGRRPVVLGGLVVFGLASLGCALSQHVGALIAFRAIQGMSAGTGVVVSRAVIRDMFPPGDAQRVMSQVTLYFGIAPAVAPIVGGFLFVHLGWHSIFWFLTAMSALLWWANQQLLPETLHVEARQPFEIRSLLRAYLAFGGSPRFMMLALASGVPFNGMFLYILSAPAFLSEQLHLPPDRYFWLFLGTIGGIMAGAWVSGRLAGRIPPHRQIRIGFTVMVGVSVANVVLNLLFAPDLAWSLWPIALYAFGWALMVPVVTLMLLDMVPERRGLASSFQACTGSLANAVVAGAVAPLVMHSAVGLAVGSGLLMCIGLGAWVWVRPRLPLPMTA